MDITGEMRGLSGVYLGDVGESQVATGILGVLHADSVSSSYLVFIMLRHALISAA